jgi:hypothetical protein
MSAGVRKPLLAAHLAVSIGWIGAAAAYLAIGIAAERSSSPETIRGAWVAMEVIGWSVLVPLALAALVTGLALAFGTRWGILRHYWVVFSLALTTVAAVVLVLHMPSVSSTADTARMAEPATLDGLGGDVGHPAIGLLVLLAVLVLNVYKPRGLTGYGRRKQAPTTLVEGVTAG